MKMKKSRFRTLSFFSQRGAGTRGACTGAPRPCELTAGAQYKFRARLGGGRGIYIFLWNSISDGIIWERHLGEAKLYYDEQESF